MSGLPSRGSETVCDANARRDRTLPRPRWGVLAAVETLTLSVLVAVEAVPWSGAVRTALRLLLTLVLFGAMALWVRSNRVALDYRDWPESAECTVTARVVASPPDASSAPSREPAPVHVGQRVTVGPRALH